MLSIVEKQSDNNYFQKGIQVRQKAVSYPFVFLDFTCSFQRDYRLLVQKNYET